MENLLEYIPASAAANFGGVIAIFVVIGFILFRMAAKCEATVRE